MAPETVAGDKHMYEEMLDVLSTQEDTPEAVDEVGSIDSDETEDEMPQARSRDKRVLSTYRNLLPKPLVTGPGCVPPVRGFFFPIQRSAAPAMPPPAQGPVAVDAGNQPYPSPYNTYPVNQNILDYELAKAKARTPLVPIGVGPAARYSSVLENDLAITTGRLAKANYEKLAAEQRLVEQAREIVELRGLIMRMQDEEAVFKEKVQDKMDEILKFVWEHSKGGTEVHLDMFELPTMD